MKTTAIIIVSTISIIKLFFYIKAKLEYKRILKYWEKELNKEK